MEAWTQFFIRAGIPKDISGRYAKSFVENRITKEMLSDLDKATLSELGVRVIGDQLLILRRIKAAKSTLSKTEDSADKPKANRERITGPTDYTQASQHRKGKPPPDSHEIYHVKMPVGNTARTQKILEKAHQMRQKGLAVRGTTGVRQGGRSVSPIDKSSIAARMMRKNQFGSAEVSSSTDRRSQLGNRIQKVTSNNSRVQKNTGIRIQVTNDNRRKHAPIVVTTSNNRHQRVQYYEDDNNEMEMDDTVTVGFADEEEDDEKIYEVEDVEFEEEDVVQVRSSSSRPRITFTTTTTSPPSRRHHNHHHAKKNDSIFDRVSFR